MAIAPDKPIPRAIRDPRLIAIARRLMEEEQAACQSCQQKWPPRHFRSFFGRDGILYQTPCGSNSRIFDPTTERFVGNPHCTCDYCF